ncbi:hypothetical protein SOPP22_15920 [Shewanella sp. OPT22]|nr:hypothetical protein SOPP22_15920 [Shewanella sp. OPT22]
MEEVAYYLSFLITFFVCFFSVVKLKSRHRTGVISSDKAKSIYSYISFVIGLLAGTVIFHGLIWSFSIFGYSANYGHGEILVAVIFYNILLSWLLLAVGRVVLGWQKQMW